MNLFRRLGAVLPGAKDQAPVQVEDDPGGFGPPGGILWTMPSDVMSDRPKPQPSIAEASVVASRAGAMGVRPDQSETAAHVYGARGGRGKTFAPDGNAAAGDQPSQAAEAPYASATPSPVVPPEPWIDILSAASPKPVDGSADIGATADISGFLGSCLVDSDSGLMLASEGGQGIDLEAAAALNTQVVRAEHEVIAALGLDDRIEDILITMTRQLHFIRPLEATPEVFLYVALDKKTANLGMARMQVNKIESGLKL